MEIIDPTNVYSYRGCIIYFSDDQTAVTIAVIKDGIQYDLKTSTINKLSPDFIVWNCILYIDSNGQNLIETYHKLKQK